MVNNLHILYPGSIYPEIIGGSIRTLNIAKLARNNFHSVSIYTADEENLFNGDLDGVLLCQQKKFHNTIDKVQYYAEGLFSKEFSIRIPDIAFDDKESVLFQTEGPNFNNLLKKRNIKKFILDQHNVYWETREFPNEDFKQRIFDVFTRHRDREIEIQALKDAAHVLVCSERDKQIFIDNVHGLEDKITVIPNCINFNEYDNFSRNYSGQRNSDYDFQVLFVGFLSYLPNLDAVKNICNEIAPNFDMNVNFLIIGKNPPKIKKPENVTFLGYVDNIKEAIFHSNVCIAPIRYGSGTRFKILEYFAMGKPVVSTSKGAEGIDYTDKRNILIEDDFYEFSGRIKELLDNPNMRNQIARNGQDLVRKKYDWSIYQKPLGNVYKNVVDLAL